jgi:hypothetical protein
MMVYVVGEQTLGCRLKLVQIDNKWRQCSRQSSWLHSVAAPFCCMCIRSELAVS